MPNHPPLETPDVIINPYRFSGGGTDPGRANLVAEYLFATNANDTSGNALNGTLNGDAAVASGVLTLDGTGDYVSVADSDLLSFTDGAGTDSAFSISCWVKSTQAVSTAHQRLVFKGNFTGSGAEYTLTLLSAGQIFAAVYKSDTTSNLVTQGLTTYTQSVWAHIVMTYDGSESETGLNVYFDGSNDNDTQTETGTYAGMSNTATPMIIGSRPVSFDQDVAGDMDNIRIYDKELSASEVTFLFTEGHS